MVAGLAALVGPAAAEAAPKASASAAAKTPVILKVTPHKTSIGKTLRIRGRYFLPGKGRNSVVFQRDGKRAVFVKADLATRKLVTVKIPASLDDYLVMRGGVGQPTRFRLRVLAGKLSKRVTGNRRSPLIGPEIFELPKPPVAPETGDCDGDGVVNGSDLHDDDDLLDDTTEVALKLDPCKVDSDGDGVHDGFEYRSARDLNDDEDEEPNTFLPYPGKRPYPNPLDATDADTDFDGDALTLKQEFALWQWGLAHGEPRSLDALSYSDGEQYTRSARGADGRRKPTLAADNYDRYQCFIDWADPAKEDACVSGEQEHGYLQVALQEPGQPWYGPRKLYDIRDLDLDGDISDSLFIYDLDHDGWLSDDERDEDADGLTNFQETRGCMNPSLWKELYGKETPFPRSYPTTDVADEDSDGDGVRDGADDQDNDDVPNIMECSRSRAGDWPKDSLAKTEEPGSPLPPPGPPADGRPAKAFVHPYNPCLPLPGVYGGNAGAVPGSRTCPTSIPPKNAGAPFNPDEKQYLFFIRN